MKDRGNRIRLLLLLALAVLGTSLAATGTLARYTSEFTATASAQVAAFAGGGTVNFDISLENLSPGELQTVDFEVCNFQENKYSDVAVEYEIQVESTGNLPLEFTLLGKSSGVQGKLTGALNSQGKAVGGKLPLAADGKGTRHSYELSVAWPAGETSEEYSHEIDMVTVTITAVQENPGGEDDESQPAA